MWRPGSCEGGHAQDAGGAKRAVADRTPAGRLPDMKIVFPTGVSVSGELAVSLLVWFAARVLSARLLVGRLVGRFCCGHVEPNGRQHCQPASTLKPGSQPAHPMQAVDQLVAPSRPSHVLAIRCVFVTIGTALAACLSEHRSSANAQTFAIRRSGSSA